LAADSVIDGGVILRSAFDSAAISDLLVCM